MAEPAAETQTAQAQKRVQISNRAVDVETQSNASTFEETESHVPGGGMVIELNGAFNSNMVVQKQIDEAGEHHLHTICDHPEHQESS